MTTPSVRRTRPTAEGKRAVSSVAALERRALLQRVVAGRLLLAIAALAWASLIWVEQPETAFILTTIVLVAVTMSGYAGHAILVRRVIPGDVMVLAQAAVDLLLVLALVHFGGPAASALAALLVVVVAVYALLLPGIRGVIVALVGALLYVVDTLWGGNGIAPTVLGGQLVVFGFVYLVVWVLSHRLRTAADVQFRLSSELRRVRLEADEILRNIRTGVMTVDGKGRLAFVNPTGARLLQLTPDRHVGEPIMECLRTRSPELHQAIRSGLDHQRRVSRGEGEVTRTDGSTFPIGLSTTTFERQLESGPAVTAIFTDISETRHLQELRMRAERLESVAALSSALAHEIRNPLAAIRSSVEQIARSPRADDDDRLLGRLIVRESDRLSRLLSEFLDFSRVRATRVTPVDLHAVATEAVNLVRAHPDCGAEMRLTVNGQRTLLDADEDLLHRVVANLVLNAVQACNGSGAIQVTVDVPPPNALPTGHDFELPVRLRVQDNGPGINAEVRDRLFQPFVSGRPGGSGLGLAIVQRAVEAHRGLVLVDSVPGTGTIFTILLHSKSRTEELA